MQSSFEKKDRQKNCLSCSILEETGYIRIKGQSLQGGIT